jgi:hypothetical protein
MAKKRILFLFLFLCIFSAFLLSSCKAQTNIFDARKIEKGEIIAGMTVEFVQVYPSDNPQNPETYMAIVRFSGEKELKGTLYHYSDQPLLGRSIVFEMAEDALDLLPRLDIDPDSDWFVIENYDYAATLLEPADSQKEASILIDHYTINYFMEVVHAADLIEIIQ